jgi:hypothetical protein
MELLLGHLVADVLNQFLLAHCERRILLLSLRSANEKIKFYINYFKHSISDGADHSGRAV